MSIYKSYNQQEIDTHLSNFLISSWSYSKVSSFARNEKAFEMTHIYNIKGRSSATTMAGNAYHKALKCFFNEYKTGKVLDIVTLERIAFEYIDERPANMWKIQKTTPTIKDCRLKATEVVTKLIRNFFSEINVYIDDIKEIIDVEVYCNEWLAVNGVDIPMPCHAQIDLVYLNVNDEITICDHKSKVSFTDEQEAQLSIGEQAITYVNAYEAKSGLEIKKVKFIENKPSQNKDKSAQIVPIKVDINKDTRRLYEHLLYEPLKRMCEAVSDPDYTYIINQADNYVDKAELYDFWMKTLLAEVGEFDVPLHKRELISKRLKKIRDASIAAVNPKVIREFQSNAADFIQYDLSGKDMTQQQKIEHVLRSFGLIVEVKHSFDGYSSNTYLLAISAGVKISSIHSHKLDIANALDVSTVRISNNLVVYENKSYLAVELAKHRERDLLYNPNDLVDMKIPIGRDNFENVIYWDLNNHSTPHVLICGATGSGKSVSIRSTINYAEQAGVDTIVIFDPKYEFMDYKNRGYKVYNEISEIEEEMAKLVEYMNELVKTGKKTKTLIVFDEFADAVSAARKGNELHIKELVEVGNYAPKKVGDGMYMDGGAKMALQKTGEHKSLEENLRVLLQKGRSTGFRIVSATQRASVKVITGDAKVNFPVQICFRVPKEVDSKVVIDEGGAEGLAGAGDGLIKSPEYKETTRFQAYYIPQND